jgi:hypothetical protein
MEGLTIIIETAIYKYMITEGTVHSRISKSARYPSIDLSFAIKVVEEARKFGRNITNSHLAGGGSVGSGAFKQKKASLGYYGLISGKEDSIQITDIAEAILNPINDTEKEEAVRKAFLAPEVFKKIYDSTEKNKAIPLSTLGNLIIREYGIPISSKNDFLNTFIKAGVYAGLIQYGSDKLEIIFLPDVTETSISIKDEEVGKNTDFNQNAGSESIVESHWVDLALDNGKKARLIVPNDLTENDKKKLLAQMKLLTGDFD